MTTDPARAELERLEAQVSAFCGAAGISVAELLWTGPAVGQALAALMRADLAREAELLESQSAQMRHRASILDGAARQLRAVLAHRAKVAATASQNPNPEPEAAP